jgi:predicted MPP superfamily phosphohydrolase
VLRYALRHVAPTWLAAAIMSWWGLVLYLSLSLLVLDGLRRTVGFVQALRKRPLPSVALAQSVVERPQDLAPAWAGAGGGPSMEHPASTVSVGEAAPPVEVVEDPARRLFLSRAVAAGALAAGGGIASLGVYRAFTPPKVNEVVIRLAGLPRALEGFTIVQLSDLHIGQVIREKFVDQLVAEANAQKADLVAITGDLVDGAPDDLGPIVARLRNLRSRHGTFFVSGNHDYYSGWERWAPVVSSMDMRVLRNERVTVGDGAAQFDLLGVDDWGSHWGGKRGYDLDAATAGRGPDRASVLLAHQPVNLEAVDAAGIGLQLSGHTHGGQLFPGTLVGSLIWGRRLAGLSRTGGTQLFTSRGCGFVGPPMRVDSPPEVVKVVLLPA